MITLPTNSDMNDPPIMVELIFRGAANEISASRTGQYQMNAMPMPTKPRIGHTTPTFPSGPGIAAPAARMSAETPVKADPMPILVTSLGSVPRRACHAHNATSGGTITMLEKLSIELNHDAGTAPKGLVRLTFPSIQTRPMFQIMG